MPSTRIYVVMQKGKAIRLVEATSAAQAIRYCAQQEYQAKVASAKDVAEASRSGIHVENATTVQSDNNTGVEP